VREQLLAGIDTGAGALACGPRHIWPARARILKIASAAAALVLVAIAGWWLIWGGTSTAAASFSQMIQNVCRARNMSWDHVVRYSDEHEHRTHTIFASNRRIRFENDDGTIQIERQAEKKGLKLRPVQKTATVMTYPKKYWAGGEPLEDLKMADAAAAQPVGKEIIDGQQTEIYQIDSPNESMRVWMDIQQKLPAQIQITSLQPGQPQTVIRMEHIRWNQDIPDSLFSVDIPPGYTRKELPKPSEEYLIKAFKVFAELPGGGFPPEFDYGQFHRFFAEHCPKMKPFVLQTNGVPSLTRDLDDVTLEQARAVVTGVQFIEEIQESAQWHYFGPGVKYGDSNAILLCWRPKDATNWRVIYGDLSVKDVAPDQMPPMPATAP
jgi:hypothetical protein